ncbi:bifunctional serine/threonine-protein kinase/formylglycine-generating enzyme family protein [Microbulbifer epialgicus]|uniref:Bifunctional serine/threonine-protein kinase/formylglycine-generating enzyme family protein n=1 Tax=Microbulbifer epialgicus TaxID=393907 RepID=A0ABV4P1Y8_9GAMM
MEVVNSGGSSLQIPGYRIVKKINQGGMSTVYLAIQRSVGRQVALKVMSPVLNADPIFSERFQREANIVGQLSHPNIVGIHDIGRYKSLNYIAMDYMPGGSVSEKLAKGPLEPLDALNVVRQIAMALDHSHSKGYVHRDLKPENILFREDGSAVLGDFGVARAVARTTRMTNSGMVVGTPYYMSPEQARGVAIDGRADLYSLGVVFYEMLTGAVPYQAEEAVAIAIKHLTDPIPRLPARHALYQPLIDRFLAKDPDKRFQRGLGVADAADQLVATLAGKPNNQISQLNNASIGVSSLARALILTLFSSLKDRITGILRRGRANPDPIEPVRTEQETLVRLRQLFNEPPKHNRWWFLSIIIVFSGIFFWGQFSLVSVKSGWQTGFPTLDDASRSSATLPQELLLSNHQGVKSAGSDEIKSRADLLQVNASTDDTLTPNLNNNPSQVPLDPSKTPLTSQAETNQSPPPTAPILDTAPVDTLETYALTVKVSPEDARIRIMNIAPRYQPGIELKPGKYDLEISKRGFAKVRRWIEIEDQDISLSVKLDQTYVAGKKIRSRLSSGGQGPEMIVIGPGSFTMGSNRHSASRPAHKVEIQHPFAISSHEITFGEYDRFALATGRARPSDASWGRGERPVINVSWRDAQKYVEWLSKETGKNYRLASEAEWEFAARGNISGPFWWQNTNAQGKANCRRGCNSEFNGLFTIKTAPVGHYEANPFGLFDTAGNVAEWVQDCYQPGYDQHQTNASSLKIVNCKLRSVRGGSMRDPANRITADYRRGLSDSARAKDVGIRVVMEFN